MKSTLSILGGLGFGIAFGVYYVMSEKKVGRPEDQESLAIVIVAMSTIVGLICGLLFAFLFRERGPAKSHFPVADSSVEPTHPAPFFVLSTVLWLPGIIYLGALSLKENASAAQFGALFGSVAGYLVWIYIISESYRKRLAAYQNRQKSLNQTETDTPSEQQ